jgi:DNA-directed RNA polymerase subunit RPC12/RpoP
VGKRFRTLAAIVLPVLVVLAIIRFTVLRPVDDAQIRPVTRVATDFMTDWTCMDCGAQETAVGGSGPRRCPKCGKEEMYSSFRFAGPNGAEYRVWFQYGADGKPSEVNVGKTGWVPYKTAEGRSNLKDPKSGELLSPLETPRSVATTDELPPE